MRYTPPDSAQFVEQRRRLAAQLLPNSVAIIVANDILPTNADGTLPFKQNSDLFYLSGVDQEEIIPINHAVVVKIAVVEPEDQAGEVVVGVDDEVIIRVDRAREIRVAIVRVHHQRVGGGDVLSTETAFANVAGRGDGEGRQTGRRIRHARGNAAAAVPRAGISC